MDGSCSPGYPCPDADAVTARDHLAGLLGEPQGRHRTGHILVRGPAMRCVSRGGAGGTRPAAFCTSLRSADISCALVRSEERRVGTECVRPSSSRWSPYPSTTKPIQIRYY